MLGQTGKKSPHPDGILPIEFQHARFFPGGNQCLGIGDFLPTPRNTPPFDKAAKIAPGFLDSQHPVKGIDPQRNNIAVDFRSGRVGGKFGRLEILPRKTDFKFLTGMPCFRSGVEACGDSLGQRFFRFHRKCS